MPVADCGVFEVGERSEVGALESLKGGRVQACLSEVGVLESPAKLGSLEILDILAQHERKRIK